MSREWRETLQTAANRVTLSKQILVQETPQPTSNPLIHGWNVETEIYANKIVINIKKMFGFSAITKSQVTVSSNI